MMRRNNIIILVLPLLCRGQMCIISKISNRVEVEFIEIHSIVQIERP